MPQYPLYSAAISLYGGSLVPYFLEEEANWGIDFNSIRQSVAAARSKGITVSDFSPFDYIIWFTRISHMVLEV